MAVRMRAFDCTLVGKHVCSREGVLGSNPTSPRILPHHFAERWRLLRNAPSKGHHSRYITLFFKGTHSVIGFYEMIGMFLVGLMHFLTYCWEYLSLFPWSYQLDQLVLQGGVRKSHYHVFLGGLDPDQAPLKTFLLMLRLT